MSDEARPAPSRIESVDLLRGLTMASMIVVNNPGSWLHMYGSLAHASWGAIPAPADFVFPFFLFLVGVSTPLSLQRRRIAGEPTRAILVRALRRAVLLFAIGVFLNLFPQFELQTLRIPGVLQRIAVVSLGCTVVWSMLSPLATSGVVMALLVGYSLLLLLVPVPGVGAPALTPETSWPVWLDERLLGAHTWRGPGDPEGVLSTIGALATALVGVVAGHALVGPWTRSRQVSMLARGGAVVLALGGLTALVVPVAKDVWTASYALVTSGVALLGLAFAHRSTSAPVSSRDGAFLLLFGRQALLAYVAAHLLSDLSIHVVRVPTGAGASLSLHSFVYQRLLLSWLPASMASLAFSLVFLLAVGAIVRTLDRRGVRIRL